MYRAVLPMSLAIMWFSRLSASTPMYCNVYMPGLQYAAGLVGYVHQQLELPIASTAPLAKISDRFSAEVYANASAKSTREALRNLGESLE